MRSQACAVRPNVVCTMKHTLRKLSAFDARRLAVAAFVDPRTLRKALSGERVSQMALARIRAALEREGLVDLLASYRTTEAHR